MHDLYKKRCIMSMSSLSWPILHYQSLEVFHNYQILSMLLAQSFEVVIVGIRAEFMRSSLELAKVVSQATLTQGL